MTSGRPLDLLANGELLDSSGTRYRRTPERLNRAAAQALVEAGCPVVTDVYPEGVTLYESQAVLEVWSEIAPRLVAGKPPRVRDLQWVGHVWEAESGAQLLYFRGAH